MYVTGSADGERLRRVGGGNWHVFIWNLQSSRPLLPDTRQPVCRRVRQPIMALISFLYSSMYTTGSFNL